MCSSQHSPTNYYCESFWFPHKCIISHTVALFMSFLNLTKRKHEPANEQSDRENVKLCSLGWIVFVMHFSIESTLTLSQCDAKLSVRFGLFVVDGLVASHVTYYSFVKSKQSSLALAFSLSLFACCETLINSKRRPFWAFVCRTG